jgi:hypothetical protein
MRRARKEEETKMMTPEQYKERYERTTHLLAIPEVREAMRIRCEEQGHQWEPMATPEAFTTFGGCRWCGKG